MPSEAEWAQLNEKLLGIPDLARQAVRGIVDGANWVLDQFWVPGAVKGWIRSVLGTLQSMAEEIIFVLAEIAAGFMFPITGFVASLQWGNLVKTPVAKAAGLISDEVLLVDDYWQGSAANAYSKAVTTQISAAKEYAAIVGELQIHLGALAAAGFGFYAAVVAVLISWVNALGASAAATAASGTAAAGPAIAAALAASAACTKAVYLMVTAYGAIVLEMVAAVTRLQGRTTTIPFSKGWPAPVQATIGPGGKDKWDKTK